MLVMGMAEGTKHERPSGRSSTCKTYRYVESDENHSPVHASRSSFGVPQAAESNGS